METILVVDDDPHIREVVCFALEQAGYHTVSTDDGVKALALHKKTQADLVVLDVLMPELDGLEVCRQLRAISNVPIVFLSSRDEEVDRVLGLELGADDYVVKPFSPRELVARVRANLRRQASNGSIDNSDTPYHPNNPNNKPIQFEGLRIDTGSFSAHFNNTALTLTQTEFHMLRTLAAHPSKVFSRDD